MHHFLESMRVLDLVDDILKDREEYQALLNVEATLSQSLLDFFQILSLRGDLTPHRRSSILKAMLRLSKYSGLCPTLLAIDDFEKDGEEPVASGGFCDIWKGRVSTELVCLKIVRVYRDSDIKKILKESMREAIIWRQLDHPNLLPFHGLYRQGSRICLISPWVANGSLTQFLEDSDGPIEHETLVWDIASGLSHLHERKIVHADLKGDNILITSHGRACIADFGLSRLTDSQVLAISSTKASSAGTLRWTAPEILISGGQHNYQSDIYAFGCVCYEVYSCHHPFHDLRNDGAVILHVHLGKRPIRPANAELTDRMWSFIEKCWHSEPSRRPFSAQLIPELKGTLGGKDIPLSPEWDQTSLSASIWSKLRQGGCDWQNVEEYLTQSGTRICMRRLEGTNSAARSPAIQGIALQPSAADSLPPISTLGLDDENSSDGIGVDPRDIDLVMSRVSCSRETAIMALRASGDDIDKALTAAKENRDVDLIMSRVNCSREEAFKVLQESGGDVIDAIIALLESDESGLDSKDIDLVVTRINCSRAKAIKVLRENDGDLINAGLIPDYVEDIDPLQIGGYDPASGQSVTSGDSDEQVLGLASTTPSDHPGELGPFIEEILSKLERSAQISHQLSPLNTDTAFRKSIQSAVYRSVRDIISPVVERSAIIAGISTKELVAKDFATEANDEKMRKAGHAMAQKLAGSLALVTCKEPLRTNLAVNMRTSLMDQGFVEVAQQPSLIENLVSDNLDLACAAIEKAAMDCAVSDVDEEFTAAYDARRRHRETRPGQHFWDTSIPSSTFSLSLPDPLRVKSSGVTVVQASVYDAFNPREEAGRLGSTIPPNGPILWTSSQLVEQQAVLSHAIARHLGL